MTTITIRESIIVDCSPEEAFALLANVNRLTEIFTNNQEVRGYHSGRLKEGDTWVAVGLFMGREVETHYTLVE